MACLFVALPAWAQAAGTNNAPLPDEPGSMGALLVRTLLVLGLVVVLIYLVLNVGLRRLVGMSGLVPGRSNVVKVLERTSLEPKRSLYLVQAAGEYFLVGGTDGGLTLLAKLDAAEVERLRADKGDRPGGSAPFWERLKARQGGSPPPTA
jgi:flagellar biosynthetic protein FliO